MDITLNEVIRNTAIAIVIIGIIVTGATHVKLNGEKQRQIAPQWQGVISQSQYDQRMEQDQTTIYFSFGLNGFILFSGFFIPWMRKRYNLPDPVILRM